MYAQLLPDILSSRIPKMADGKQYPVAGARVLGEAHAALQRRGELGLGRRGRRRGRRRHRETRTELEPEAKPGSLRCET